MKIFSSVSALAAATLTSDQIVKVKSVGEYRIQNSGSGITLANGRVAVPVASGTAVNVLQWGADPTGVQDSTAAIQAARDFIAASSTHKELVFPAGIYLYSVSPNWAIQDATIRAVGEVRLRYTGTGNAVIIDADAGDAVVFTAGLCYNVTMTHFIVDAPTTAQNGVYVRSIHHSRLGFTVRGAGATYAGIRVEFAVCTIFDKPTVSVNQEAWYTNAKPKYGLFLTRRNVAEECSYCTFNNPILEGTEVGALLEWALGNSFFGGTMEGCTDTGIDIQSNSRLNKLFNVDYEVNTNVDIYCAGYENEFYGCDSDTYSLIPAAGHHNLFIGGSYEDFAVASGAEDNTITAIRYNRFGAGGFSDAGTRTRLSDLNDIANDLHHNTLLTQTSITVGASPFTYVNDTANEQTISVVGGTVSYLGFNRGGVGNSAGITNGQVTLSPNDEVTVVYTATPTMIKLTR